MSTYKKSRSGFVTTTKTQLKHQLSVRYAKIVGVPWPEALENPLVQKLVQNTLDGQIIYIDNNRKCIVGLPSGEQ